MIENFFYILLSITGAIQVVAYVALVWPTSAVINEQLFLYVLFLASFGGIYTLAKRLLPNHWQVTAYRQQWIIFLSIEMILTFFLVSAWFKLIVFDRWPQIAQSMYNILLVLLVLNKIFAPAISRFMQGVDAFIQRPSNAPILRIVAVISFVGVIALLLYLPDRAAVVARVYMGEQFHNWDFCVFGPAYAYAKGAILNVEVISNYGLGMPMVMAYLMKLIGGISYEHMLAVLMGLCIAYYVAWFFLLRQWLGSILLAMAGILFGMRTQLFHALAYPLTYTYPSGTPLRFFMDVIVFFLVWQHLKTGRPWILYAAAACCGFMIFYMTAEGLYLSGALGVYLLMRVIGGQERLRLMRALGVFLLIPIVTAMFLVLTQGKYVISQIFWQNMGEFRQYFFSGFALGAMENSLKAGNFLESLMGFVVPMVYLLTVLIAGSCWLLRQAPGRYLLAVVIAIEGLGLYHYYTLLGFGGSYYMLGLPFNFLVAFWINEGLRLFQEKDRRRIGLALVGIAAWALVTNHNFISYPNVVNLSRNPMVDKAVVQYPMGRQAYFNHLFMEYPESAKLPQNSLGEIDEKLRFEKDFVSDEDLKIYYTQETNFSRDAQLIQRWTAPDEKVALISSFEVMMMAQANRKPFFYHFPLLNSRPLRMRMFHIALVYTNTQLKRLLNALEEGQPQYLFMERIFLNRQVPSSYYYDNPALMALLNYVHQHYQPIETGQYLVAMKRI